ncbi:Solute carrier family 12 member 2 (Na-K-Cl cotransporter 1) [Durusdinium trenchii]|uniref:Solute carrier family 12 member 2 (Na-K-Cl cotransporter 1) n=1 Tax=Durusdinium trenchii TaxID=1381693 RepID=A0ABP0IR06_9DINO
MEQSPSTVVYRSENSRTTLQELIDTVANNGGESSSPGTDSSLSSFKVAPPPRSLSAGSEEELDKVLNNPEKTAAKLSWVQGVFVPCLLNIWGVIMFLRLGWVVGQAGILLACLIVFMSKVVTSLTALSLCAICTNGEVKGGGVYFLISRALGPVYGGTIGVLFFLAQAVATSLYVIGFAESLSFLLVDSGVPLITGNELNDIRVLGLITTVLLLGVAMVGVGWYAKCQVGLLVTLVVSMLSVIIGAGFPGIPDELENEEAGFVGFGWRNLGSTFSTDPDTPGTTQDFFTVFAVFFPAATGVMAGANLSGDLKDPSHAIPKGTLGAIALTFVSYIGLIFVVGTAALVCSDLEGETYCETIEESVQNGNIPNGGLLFNKLIMQNMSIWAPLFYVGVFAATLSSALASLVGAPRILQSLADDKIFPWPALNYFGKGHGVNNEPIRAYMLTFVICCGCVVIGKLDVIAPVISNFFMVSYAFTNYACFASTVAHYPGWRPSFKYYNKWLSLAGFFICIAVMFLMDWVTSILTVVVAAMLYVYLLWLDPAVNWGAAGEARKYFSTLKRMEDLQGNTNEHVKTFRPQFLVMSGQPGDGRGLIKFVSLLKKGGGVMICGDVVLNSEVHLEDDAEHTTKEPPSPRVGRGNAIGGRANNNKDAAPSHMLEDITEEDEEDEEDANVTEEEDELDPARDSDRASAVACVDGSHLELGSVLAKRLETVMKRRVAGDDFLSARNVWGGKRCPGAFFEAVVGDSLLDGFQSLLQCSGLGRIRPNTVVLGYKYKWRKSSLAEIKEYEQMIRITLSSNLGIMIVRDDLDIFDFDCPAGNAHGIRRVLPCFPSAVLDDEDGPTESTLNQGNASAGEEEEQEQEQESPGPDLEAGASPADLTLDVASPVDTKTGKVVNVTRNRELSCPKTSLQGDTIDVWWVSDDGGLTMLIPHLLRANRLLRGKRLRVLTVTNYNIQETSKLQKTEFRMVHLLKKFRIDAQVEAVEANLSSPASRKTVEEFESLGELDMDKLTVQEQAKTNHTLRLAELIREHTNDRTSIVFVTLPIPETGIAVGLYTSWLHMLSDGLPPTIMMRGNNEDSLTFIC